MLAKYGAVDAIEITPLAWERLHKCYGLRTLYTTPIPFNIDCAYDAIVAMDVLEHIENDGAAMRWIADHLADDGFLVLTVPAYPWLYGFHDIATRHYRRYTKSSLLRIVPSDLRVLRVGHFNVNLFPLAVCGRIASALWRFLMRTRSESKQSSRLPRLIDELFGAVLLREARQIARGREPSLGLSLFLLAQRSGG
jgi:SAM-dependent methyltransferase